MKKRPSAATLATKSKTKPKKRPAQPVEYEHLRNDAHQTMMQPGCRPMMQPGWAQAGLGPSPQHPKWAEHLVNALLNCELLPRNVSRRDCTLQVWSDCSGINSEMLALAAINTALANTIGAQLAVNLYCACDLDKDCRRLAQHMYQPTHLSSDVRHRNFDQGKFFCELCQENIDMPQTGIDLYVGTYPCSPWSRRGKRSGWDHPEIIPLFIGLQTIRYMRPATFVLELGELHDHSARSEIQEKIDECLNSNGGLYMMQTIGELSPIFSGYPIQRPRFFVLGWRVDTGTPEAMAAPSCHLLANPLDVQQTFIGFLHLRRKTDWSRVGEYMNDEEFQWWSNNPCSCSADPMTKCQVHRCKCGRCGDDGLRCTWRTLLVEYVAKAWPGGMIGSEPGKLTYLQAHEMSGAKGPEAPRLRTYINIMALHPSARPLNDTLMVVDVSQNPPYQGIRHDGCVPTVSTSSTPFCFQLGEFLTTYNMASLMGMQLEMINLSGFSEAWFRKKIGMCVHPASFGVSLVALLAAPLAKLWGRASYSVDIAGV